MMRIIFLCLLLFISGTAKAAPPDGTATECSHLDDNEYNVVLWKSLFTKINTILGETIELRKSQNSLTESIVKLSKRQDAQELTFTKFMENAQKQFTDLKKGRDAQEPKLNTFMANTQKHLTDLKKGLDAQELKLANFAANTQNYFADLMTGIEAQYPKLHSFMERTENHFENLMYRNDVQNGMLATVMANTETNFSGLKKGQGRAEPKLANFGDISQKPFYGQDIQPAVGNNFGENIENHIINLKKEQDEQELANLVNIPEERFYGQDEHELANLEEEEPFYGQDIQPAVGNNFEEKIENYLINLKKGQEAHDRRLTHFMKLYFYKNNEWLTILRRQDGSLNFYRNWTEYQKGFGNPDGEFFIGLEKLHALTTLGVPQELMLLMENFENEKGIAKYDLFQIGNESEKYILKELGTYSGNAGDSLSQHKGHMFSTHDQNNDKSNCSQYYKAAWWFSKCYYSNLFGLYRNQKNQNMRGVDWNTWQNSLKFAEMKIRSKSF